MKNPEARQFVLRVIIAGVGAGCIATGVFMAYQGKTMPIAGIPISAGLIFLIAGLILALVSLAIRRPSQEDSIDPLYILLLVLVVFLIVYASTHYTLKQPDKYTILVDLILIMVALAGAAGYAVYQLIFRRMEDRLTTATRESENFTRAQVEINLGFWYFEQYEAESKKKKEMDKTKAKLAEIQSHLKHKGNPRTEHRPPNNYLMNYLEHAVERTMRALEFLKELDPEKHEELICACKNNLAYYLAERQRQGRAKPGDKELAKEYARYIQARIGTYPSFKTHFSDTCDFVSQQFPDNSD